MRDTEDDHREGLMATVDSIKEQLIDKLIESGHLHSIYKIEPIPPGHGSCCTCQKCGQVYEDCVCGHNKILDIIENAFDLNKMNYYI